MQYFYYQLTAQLVLRTLSQIPFSILRSLAMLNTLHIFTLLSTLMFILPATWLNIQLPFIF